MGRNVERVVRVGLLLVVKLALVPVVASAQSSIAGSVKDTTGAVLPGVTVEAASAALIEKVRTVITDDQGQYKIIDLRPGTYAVTFTLPGFNTVIRDGIALESNFTAPVNVEMRVGALEETVTVSGSSPIVDVQSTQQREVVTREMLDVLPTGRSPYAAAITLAAVNLKTGPGGPRNSDVAGSANMRSGALEAYGGLGGDTVYEVDGMAVSQMNSSGLNPGVTHNEAEFQEYVVQVSSGTADTATGGVRLNLIPKEGGNRFNGGMVGFFSNSSLQSDNFTDKLRSRGLTTANRLYRLHDVGANLGGPLKRDKLWFFSSVRNWTYMPYVANVFLPDGSQAIDDSLFQSYMTRLTYQVNTKNKISAVYDRLPKERDHFGFDLGATDWKATAVQDCPVCYYSQVKWTSTVSNKLLFEAGVSILYFQWNFAYQPEIKRPSATDPYGDIAKTDLILGLEYNSFTHRNPEHASNPRHAFVSSATYVTGSHAIKVGYQYAFGSAGSRKDAPTILNGDLHQRYRNRVPDSVEARNTPLEARTEVKADLGLYVQDSWTINRLTLNPGLRWQYFLGEIPEQSAPAGRFVAARHFDRITNIPNWKNFAPRFGAAYDLFGNGKTAIKGSVGKYLNQQAAGFMDPYNPMFNSSDIRTWTDRNGDDIAQDDELGPSTNVNFGIRRNRNPDPDLKRPYQLLYNLGMQHELRPGLGISVSYNRRGFYDMTWTNNLAVPPESIATSYTLVTIPDPRGNGQTITVYNLNRDFLGLVNDLDTHSDQNKRTYNGIDAVVSARLPGGTTLLGGTSTGRTRTVTCQVADPNLLRFCDQTQFDVPFQTAFKVAGSHPLPYGIQLSGVFQHVPGDQFTIRYLVNRTIIPTLTLAQVSVPLNEPGQDYDQPINQLDFSVAKTFRFGNTKLTPQIDIFNALNASPVLNQNAVFGPQLGRPNRILEARLLRVGVRLEF